ncbi:DUF2000 domain-containing protein [Mycetocola tolaasinivorans]|uniref:DUF2000 domain-containing protein n=1 Tax=Mycetocola tolaasinivorans TaxID=76635 RepID=A0A3L7AB03_9MICO|nr:DUF2000 domain-containing protein [Mycetocola tolaasinivorans]
MNELNTTKPGDNRVSGARIGFLPEEIRPGEPTRSARLKWVIVVSADLPAGRIANAVACVAAVAGDDVFGMLGEPAVDASGSPHAGLPWAGCSIVVAPADRLASIRARAAARDDVHVADMPTLAQETRVYAEYLEGLSGLEPPAVTYAAVGLVGERKRIDRLVGGLALLG